MTIKKNIYILDGGFSSQLEKLGCVISEADPLWSTRFLVTNPEAVIEVHQQFISAGSDVISTNTYQGSVESFQNAGFSRNEALEYIDKAVKLANLAITSLGYSRYKSNNPKNDKKIILVAGSVGPYGAALCDGSEYNGNYPGYANKEFLSVWHMPRILQLIKSGVDLLACETLPKLVEAQAIISIIDEYNAQNNVQIKLWCTFTLQEHQSNNYSVNITDGTPFIDVYKALMYHPAIIALGVNCVNPNLIEPLAKEVAKWNTNQCKDAFKHQEIKFFNTVIECKYPKPLIVYPNRGELWDAEAKIWYGRDKCEPLENFVHTWISKYGINFIGGCCRVYASDISSMVICSSDYL